MNPQEIDRLSLIEKRIDEICKEHGLNTTTINFEIVTAEKNDRGYGLQTPNKLLSLEFR